MHAVAAPDMSNPFADAIPDPTTGEDEAAFPPPRAASDPPPPAASAEVGTPVGAAAAPHVGEPSPARDNWTAVLLEPRADATLTDDARRLATGVGLSALYGVALGARDGGAAFFKSAALVPAALVAACAFGLPALYITLGMIDAPTSARGLFGNAARATATAGVALAGLAPVAALYVVSSEGRFGAACAAVGGLVAGSCVGLRALTRGLFDDVKGARESVRAVSVGATLAFAVFAAAVAIRVWSALPLFATGGR